METEAGHSAFRGRPHAMKKHLATRLHYDLRLEGNGVMLSWALPQGPNCRAGAISTAIEMEDHRRKYLLFEGVHETGPIMLWDRGIWEPYPEFDDVEGSLRRGLMRFPLHGEKLRGGWALARTNGARSASRPLWTISKLADSFAENANKNILEEQPNSVTTERTIEEIVRDWTSPRPNASG